MRGGEEAYPWGAGAYPPPGQLGPAGWGAYAAVLLFLGFGPTELGDTGEDLLQNAAPGGAGLKAQGILLNSRMLS